MGAEPGAGDQGVRLERSAIDGQVLWTLVRAARRAEHRLTADLAGLELSPVQFGVLSQLAVEASASNARLARLCFVRPQTMAGVVDGMVRRDLVRREGPGGRGRPAGIELTAHGEDVLARAWPIFLATSAAIVPGPDDAAAQHLNDVLHRVARPERESGT